MENMFPTWFTKDGLIQRMCTKEEIAAECKRIAETASIKGGCFEFTVEARFPGEVRAAIAAEVFRRFPGCMDYAYGTDISSRGDPPQIFWTVIRDPWVVPIGVHYRIKIFE